MALLVVEKVTKRFGGLTAVNGLDFHVNCGEIVGLIGPNGAGKTTLFNCVCGFYKPTSGRIIFNEEDIAGARPSRICRKGIARTFQLVEVFPNMTTLENIVAGMIFGKSKKADPEIIEKESNRLIELVGLSGKENVTTKELTFNDKKSVELGRALATKPELLLWDELIAGLNPAEIAQKTELIMRIRDSGVTVLLIEHVMKAIMDLSDRIIVIHHGEKIAEGKPQDIAEDQVVIDAYLGEKYTF